MNSGSRSVALLAEGVDRNMMSVVLFSLSRKSPSSRRAWIEIRSRPVYFPSLSSPSSRRAWIEI